MSLTICFLELSEKSPRDPNEFESPTINGPSVSESLEVYWIILVEMNILQESHITLLH